MNKKLKITLIILGVIIVLFMGLTGVVVNSLPGPKEIGRSMKPSDTSATPKAPAVTPSEVPSKNPGVAEAPSDDQIKNEALVKALFEEDAADIRVCENLGVSPIYQRSAKKDDLDFKEIFADTDRNDAFAESLRVPIREVIQDEQVSSLIKEVMGFDKNMKDDEKDSFFTKIGFYGRIASTTAHLYGRKREFEKLADRAIHLNVLSRLTTMKPELANESGVRSFCDTLERSIALKDEVDIPKERAELVKMIEAAGLKPQDLGFDPEEYIKFKIQSSNKGLTFTLTSKDEENKKKDSK